MQQAEKKAKNVEQVVFTVKKLNKEICKELSTLEEKAKLRLKRKLADRLLGTQQLGRGKFTPEDRPFLLTDELSGSLREIKPQGDVLVARLKSLQKRNMMPVPGEKRIRSKLKKKLRVKKIEKRSHKEVTLGSRGDVLVARLKSLQKRNMMPVPGEKRIRSKLKKKLRVKKIEKRSHKESTYAYGARLICAALFYRQHTVCFYMI
ncbi:unnamed protein product [Toxocara canis]|uniref:Ribosome biogenesis protein NOP53 n=1 Tax=Toxocara canis TaxID=6265 RepID=A0A183V3D6_TOXCA|nr:unnamed protein product [Toxocara canis]